MSLKLSPRIDIEIEEELDCDDEEMFAAEDAEEVEPPPIKLLPRGIAQWEIRRHQLDAGAQEAQFRILNTPTEEIDVTRRKQLAKVTETLAKAQGDAEVRPPEPRMTLTRPPSNPHHSPGEVRLGCPSGGWI